MRPFTIFDKPNLQRIPPKTSIRNTHRKGTLFSTDREKIVGLTPAQYNQAVPNARPAIVREST
jgi:hypothetical protein